LLFISDCHPPFHGFKNMFPADAINRGDLHRAALSACLTETLQLTRSLPEPVQHEHREIHAPGLLLRHIEESSERPSPFLLLHACQRRLHQNMRSGLGMDPQHLYSSAQERHFSSNDRWRTPDFTRS
jgi:hypothetical protein